MPQGKVREIERRKTKGALTEDVSASQLPKVMNKPAVKIAMEGKKIQFNILNWFHSP